MRPLILTSLFSLLVVSIAVAQVPDQERQQPLRGIREIRVVVESLHPSSTAAGLVVSQIQAEAELQLRKRGVPVMRSTSSTESPYLYLRVTTRKDSSGGYPYNVELLLRDMVRLVRDNTIATRATTWNFIRGGYLDYTGGKDELAQDIQKDIRDIVNKFVDDYVAANLQKQMKPN